VVYTWEDAARGAEARFPGLDDLAGATLELRGYDAGGNHHHQERRSQD
jgi:hypothetical protein